MQRLRIFFLVCALCICTSAALHAQTPARTDTTDRIIYWVHGLNEDKVFWTMYSNYFNQQRLTRGFVQEYESIVAIPIIALRVKSDIDQSVRDGDPKFRSLRKPIFIGHSMGGLVSRTVVRDYPYSGVPPMLQLPYDPLDWGGIISVGTPHRGAPILPNLNKGYLDKFIIHADNEISTALILDFTDSRILNPLLAFFLSQGIVGSLADVVNTNVLYPIKNLLYVTNIKGLREDCVRDLNTESAFIANLNSVTPNPNIPSIGIFGTAKWQSHLRIGSSALNHPAQTALDQAKDDDLPKKARTISNNYRGIVAYKNAQVTNIIAANVHDPYSVTAKEVLEFAVKAFSRAADFIDYGSQIDWAVIIGSARTKTQTYSVPVVNAASIETSVWNTSVNLTHFLVEPNDGIVPKASQLFPGSQYQPREAKGANHLIEGNHRNVRTALEDIFDTPGVFFTSRK